MFGSHLALNPAEAMSNRFLACTPLVFAAGIGPRPPYSYGLRSVGLTCTCVQLLCFDLLKQTLAKRTQYSLKLTEHCTLNNVHFCRWYWFHIGIRWKSVLCNAGSWWDDQWGCTSNGIWSIVWGCCKGLPRPPCKYCQKNTSEGHSFKTLQLIKQISVSLQVSVQFYLEFELKTKYFLSDSESHVFYMGPINISKSCPTLFYTIIKCNHIGQPW